jgi:uncharacterized protein DUF4919
MRTQLFAGAFLACACFPLLSVSQAAPSEYSKLVATLQAGNTDVDYGRLRLSYMDSPEYKQAKDTDKKEKAMASELGAKNYAAALKDANTVLASDYVNMDAHFVAYVANRELGAADKANFHQAVFHGLVDSIFKSGDGKSPEKAWVVITVHEEYVILRVLGYRPSQQSLQNKDGHAFDVMNVKKIDDGSEATFYFNVDIAMKHEF